MNNSIIKKNIGISMVIKPISMILSFIYTPIALSFLGETKYGVWAIILNILTWINYFDIGIGNGLRNKLTESYTKGDEKSSQIYISTAYLATGLISFAFCGIIILIWNVFNLTHFFNLAVEGDNSSVIVTISIIFVAINFIISLGKTIMYAIQIPSAASIVDVTAQVLQVVVLWILSKFFSESLLAVALMYGIVGLLTNMFLNIYIFKKYPFLRLRLDMVQKQYLKPLMTLGIGFFIMQICSLVLNTTDNLLIANLYSSADVTPYNMVYKFFYIIIQIHAIIIMPMWSAYTAANTQNDITWIQRTMKKINIITLILAIGALIGIFVFKPFAVLWLQRELLYEEGLIPIVAVYMIVQMFANNYSAFLCGVGHIKVSVIISVIGAIINIPLSIFLAEYIGLGVVGIIIGSLVIMAISIAILPIVSSNWINKKVQKNG